MNENNNPELTEPGPGAWPKLDTQPAARRYLVEFDTADGVMTRHIDADETRWWLDNQIVHFITGDRVTAVIYNVCLVREVSNVEG